ncbi:hypothetical protein [Actinokineospora sp. HUAS TT18]
MIETLLTVLTQVVTALVTALLTPPTVRAWNRMRARRQERR